MTESMRRIGSIERPSFDEAMAIIAAQTPSLAPTSMAVADALGTVLFADVRALDDFPRFNAAAMDGYALDAALAAHATPSDVVNLRVMPEDIRAGGATPPNSSAVAWPISTGAAVPEGCDAILIREKAQLFKGTNGPFLRFDRPLPENRNIRRQGEDARRHDVVLCAGTRITSAMIGALICYGVRTVQVRRFPTIAILPTGDELMSSKGNTLEATQIYDSNSPMIAALAHESGIETVRGEIAIDRDDRINDALDRLMVNPDLRIILSTGGASVGVYDRIQSILRERGATVHFAGVRMRPGKPVIFATLPDGRLFFGLPGNPVAALLGFRFFVMAAARHMAGAPVEEGSAVATDDPGREGTSLFLSVCEDHDAAGARTVTILPAQGAHRMRPLLSATAWLKIDRPGGAAARALLFPRIAP